MARPDSVARVVAPKFGATVRRGLLLGGLSLALTGCGINAPTPGIYLSELGSTAPRLVAAAEGRPVWSPDGDAIAWGNEDGLFLHDLERGTTRSLSNASVAGKPAWSPDGQSIAFVNWDQETLAVHSVSAGEQLFSVPIATENARRPAPALLTTGSPSWSPDGEQIAYACWDGMGDEICLIGADGENARQLTQIDSATDGASTGSGPRAGANAGPSTWSPDGKMLAAAVYGERRGAPAGVFVIDPVAGTAEKLSALAPNSPVVWTSGSDSVIFSAVKDDRGDVYLASLNGDGAQALTTALAGGAGNPALHPDGARLALESGGQILVVDLGSEVADSIAIDTQLGDAYPAWSPDGTRLAFVAAADPISGFP